MMKRLFAGLILGLGLLHAALAETAVQPPTMIQRVERALWWGDFAELERLLRLAEADTGIDDNGDTELMKFNRGMGYLGSRAHEHPAYLNEVLRLTQDWAASRPDSALAHRLVAEAHIDLAWYERGGGYANTVSEQGWKAFRSHVEAARAYLLHHPAALEHSSQPYHPLLTIGMASSWSSKLMMTLVREGLKRNPRDYELFFKALPALTPRWGGDARSVDELVSLAVQHTEAEFGLEYYARLYSAAAQNHYKQTLFEASRAKWPRMKQGYQQMIARHVGDRPLNRYAMYACLAKDRAAFEEALALLAQRQQELRADIWEQLGGQRMIDGCQRWGSGS